MSHFAKKCSNCKNYEGNKLICESCAHYDHPITVFEHITASLEKLAEKLVYFDNDVEEKYIFYSDSSESCRIFTSGWTSNILKVYYDTKEEAIAATVERLKEIYHE